MFLSFSNTKHSESENFHRAWVAVEEREQVK